MSLKTRKGNTVDFGIAVLHNPNCDESTFSFPIDSLLEWYPLDSRYTIGYAQKRNHIYVTPTRNIKDTFYSYGIRHKVGRAQSKKVSCTTYLLYIDEVYQDNKKVIDFCKKNSIITLGTICNREELNESFSRVMLLLDSRTTTIVLRYLADNPEVELKASTADKVEEQALLLYSTEEDNKYFNMLGKVLTMLHLVRKFYCRG